MCSFVFSVPMNIPFLVVLCIVACCHISAASTMTKSVRNSVNKVNKHGAELKNELSACVKTLQMVNVIDADSIVEKVVQRLKCVFRGFIYNQKNECEQLEMLRDLDRTEEAVFSKMKVEMSDIKCVLDLLNGEPESALYLAYAYEIVGLYHIALLWSEVACELGNSRSHLARNEIKRIISMLQRYD